MSEKQTAINVENGLELQPNLKQQNKIIAALLLRDNDYLFNDDVHIDNKYREEFYDYIGDKKIKDKDISIMLQGVVSPINEEYDLNYPINTFNKLASDKHMMGIVAQFGCGNLEKRDTLEPKDLVSFVTLYPDPCSFEETADAFLDLIEANNSSQKRREYETALGKLGNIVYGKRQEYYNQVKILKPEAERKKRPIHYETAKTAELVNFSDQAALKICEKSLAKTFENRKESEIENIINAKIEYVNEKEANEILARSKIEADDFRGTYLNKQMLQEEDLGPRYKIDVDNNTSYYISDMYRQGATRSALVGYVKCGDKVSTRSFYLSNSQGVWRYVPDYEDNFEGVEKSVWMGKGYNGASEDSLNLPVAMQKALHVIKNEKDVKELKIDSSLVFYGTCKKYGNKQGDYYKEVSEDPQFLQLNPDSFHAPNKKNRPERIRLSEAEMPNSANKITEYKKQTVRYGEVYATVHLSNNGKLKYEFNTDKLGRSWVAYVENDSRVTSCGVKKDRIAVGDLTTPAFEYKSQEAGYGNDNFTSGEYIDMYENYLSKIPVIQKYHESILGSNEKTA